MSVATRRYELRIYWRNIHGKLRWQCPISHKDGEDQGEACGRLVALTRDARAGQPYWITKQEMTVDNRHIGDVWIVEGSEY